MELSRAEIKLALIVLGAIALAADPDLAGLDGLAGSAGEPGASRAVTDWTTTGVLTPERI